MKIVNNIIRALSVLAAAAALALYFFFGKSKGELIGSTITVIISAITIFFVTFIPSVLKKRNIIMSKSLYIIILVAIVLSMGGGFIFRFYEIFSYYDTIVHFLNGMNIVIIVFVILSYYAKEPERYAVPIIIISILAAISLGTLWEIYEFIVDVVATNSNMQRFRDVQTGIDYVGQAALKDTMIDLLVDTLGAVIAGILLYIDSISKRRFIKTIILKNIE
ncbi:MAG: DUF2238 domain-containing protein [Acholeplasmataceae bacterium]|jgi:uncharacterized membrane protein YjdF|nr:DUF2238 domain-containing protein [Acholeplasmataceae bacterium]